MDDLNSKDIILAICNEFKAVEEKVLEIWIMDVLQKEDGGPAVGAVWIAPREIENYKILGKLYLYYYHIIKISL